MPEQGFAVHNARQRFKDAGPFPLVVKNLHQGARLAPETDADIGFDQLFQRLSLHAVKLTQQGLTVPRHFVHRRLVAAPRQNVEIRVRIAAEARDRLTARGLGQVAVNGGFHPEPRGLRQGCRLQLRRFGGHEVGWPGVGRRARQVDIRLDHALHRRAPKFLQQNCSQITNFGHLRVGFDGVRIFRRVGFGCGRGAQNRDRRALGLQNGHVVQQRGRGGADLRRRFRRWGDFLFGRRRRGPGA